jgi:hypothetical protein
MAIADQNSECIVKGGYFFLHRMAYSDGQVDSVDFALEWRWASENADKS